MANDVDRYLRECAHSAGSTPDAVLRRVLHLEPDPSFITSLFPGASNEVQALFKDLDYAIKVRSPGFHYVRRSTYLGYRREGAAFDSPVGERSQVFASVITGRAKSIQVVLPVDPAPYLRLRQVSDLRGTGHHGIGELKFVIADEEDLLQFTDAFNDWLCSPDSSRVAK